MRTKYSGVKFVAPLSEMVAHFGKFRIITKQNKRHRCSLLNGNLVIEHHGLTRIETNPTRRKYICFPRPWKTYSSKVVMKCDIRALSERIY